MILSAAIFLLNISYYFIFNIKLIMIPFNFYLLERNENNMIKKLFVSSLFICTVCILIPAAMGALLFNGGKEDEKTFLYSDNIPLAQNTEIYIDSEENYKSDENIDYNSIDYTPNKLEQYIVSVTAAEMPASFCFEALKAQAVAARTYALKHLDSNYDNIDPSKIGQAFISEAQMKKRWSNSFDKNYKKIKAAVYSTRGLIMEYDGEPIEAVFHSTSAGITESAQNVWGKDLPYIKSVESEEDINAPNFMVTVSFSKKEFENKIKNSINAAKKLDNIFDSFKITKRSYAGYVLEAELGGAAASGKEIREALGLRSSDFEVKKSQNEIYFTTKGYGHGAGMSQYGAEFMAREGKSFYEILNHYYSGIEITSAE